MKVSLKADATAAILAAGAGFLPLVAVYFSAGLIWLPLIVMVLLLLAGPKGRRLPHFSWWITGIFLLFFLYGAATWIWSVDPGRTLGRLPDLAAVLAGIVLILGAARNLNRDDYRRVFLALGGSMSLAVAILVVERISGAPIMQSFGHDPVAQGVSVWTFFNKGLTILALLIWPAVLGLRSIGYPIWGWALGIGLLLCLWLYEGGAQTFSITVAAVCAVAVWCRGRNFIRLLRIMAVAWVVVAPFAFHFALRDVSLEPYVDRVETSVLHRLYIWQFASHRVVERPVAGYGLDTARSIPGAGQKVLLQTDPVRTYGDLLPLHPHSVSLQVWLETGVIGAVLAACFAWLLFHIPLAVADRWGAAAVTGQLIAGFGVANLSYGAWQAWWNAGFALAAVFMLMVLEHRKKAME